LCDGSHYKSKEKFGDMDFYEAKRLRTVEDHKGRLKKLQPEKRMHNVALKVAIAKKW
jgi:putative transposase